VPGDVRAPWEHTNQARQILNDAEDDLKDWQPELEDVPSNANLDHAALGRTQNVGTNAEAEDGLVHSQGHEEGVGRREQAQDGSRVSSGSSVTTGQNPQSYASTEATQSVAA